MSYKNISKKQIEEIYFRPGMTGRKSAKELGITYKTFRSKLNKFGIKVKVRKSKYPELNDKEWLKKEYIDNKKSIRQIAIDINATVGAVNSAIRWLGIETRKSREAYSLKFPNGRFGENAGNWQGGKRKAGSGYIMLYKPKHPNCTLEGYVMEHRLEMEKEIDRYLEKNEIVHHINGKKDDNRIKNLELTVKGEHTKQHFKDSFEVKEIRDEIKLLKSIINNCSKCKKLYEEKSNKIKN